MHPIARQSFEGAVQVIQPWVMHAIYSKVPFLTVFFGNMYLLEYCQLAQDGIVGSEMHLNLLMPAGSACRSCDRHLCRICRNRLLTNCV